MLPEGIEDPPPGDAAPTRGFSGNCGNPPDNWKTTFNAPWISNGRWTAIDRLFLLQARPLLVIPKTTDQSPEPAHDYPGHPLVIEGGKCAASGVVAGRVLVLKNTETDDTIPTA